MTARNLPLPLLLSVSDVTRLIRDSLEAQFRDIWIEGSVCNLRAPSSGHLYLTIKDDQSQLRAVCFRSAVARLRFVIEEGMAIIARGRISVYEPRGEYQLVIDEVEPKGIGAFQLAFEQLRARLASEGLFDEARKRPLPFFPATVGVVTSRTGAALHDILAVIHRRCPLVHVLIAPVPVQGEGAAERIAGAISSLAAVPHVEVLIVGRGGGAAEDLWAFNDEVVVRAIVQSRVPVVSAVGHEIDVTLSDFAADYRAPTPSAAAEAVVPVLEELAERFEQQRARLQRTIQTFILLQRHRLDQSVRTLHEMRFRLHAQAQRLDELADSLRRTVKARLQRLDRTRAERHHALLAHGPQRRIQTAFVLLPQLVKRLEQEARRGLLSRRQKLAAQLTALDALSPLAILTRGYSVLYSVASGRVVRKASELKVGEMIHARLSEGRLRCLVKDILPPSAS
jgi:exodeoxyribonuclease VII large subunit